MKYHKMNTVKIIWEIYSTEILFPYTYNVCSVDGYNKVREENQIIANLFIAKTREKKLIILYFL